MMDETVASQLERLYERIEFNDDFELDILAPHTWLAEWQARFELEQRLAGRVGVEVLELSLPPEQDVLEPGLHFAAALARTPRVLVVHVRDEDGDSRRWQPFFRRLNETRNAVVREMRGNLVLLIAPGLVTEFAAEAPDMWSVGAVMVIGSHTREQLDEQMFDHVPALLALTWMPIDAAKQLAARVADGWTAAASERSPVRRGRQLFELLLRFDPSTFERLDVRPDVPAFSCQLHHAARAGGRSFFVRVPPVDRPICAIHQITANAAVRLLDDAQWYAQFGYRVLHIAHDLEPCSRLLARSRRCFDLVLFESSRSGWDVAAGGTRDAPAIRIAARLLPLVSIDLALGGRSEGHVRLALDGEFQASARQLWLPHVDPAELGTMPLYRAPPGSE
jgi:hypothetical protein